MKFSPVSSRTINPCKNKRCKACGLYLNQYPISDSKKKSNIFWVGLSAVQFEEHEVQKPLAAHTRSGALIQTIEESFANEISFYKTNLVKCVPLKSNKIRYPLEHEMEKCYPNLEDEIHELTPSVVFLLGKQVATFVLKKLEISEFNLDENFNYSSFDVNNIKYVPVHHPSFVLVYKRKYLDDYINSIQSLFLHFLIPVCKTA